MAWSSISAGIYPQTSFSDVLAVKHLLPFVYTDMDYIIIIHIVHTDSIFRIEVLKTFIFEGVDIYISLYLVFLYVTILSFFITSWSRNDLTSRLVKTKESSAFSDLCSLITSSASRVEPEAVFRLTVYLIGHRFIAVYVDCIVNNLERYGSALRVGIIYRIPFDAHQRHFCFIVHPDAL